MNKIYLLRRFNIGQNSGITLFASHSLNFILNYMVSELQVTKATNNEIGIKQRWFYSMAEMSNYLFDNYKNFLHLSFLSNEYEYIIEAVDFLNI